MVAKLGLDNPVGAGAPSAHPQLQTDYKRPRMEGAHSQRLVSKHERSPVVQLAEVKASRQLAGTATCVFTQLLVTVPTRQIETSPV